MIISICSDLLPNFLWTPPLPMASTVIKLFVSIWRQTSQYFEVSWRQQLILRAFKPVHENAGTYLDILDIAL